jgi:hypothetical protein
VGLRHSGDMWRHPLLKVLLLVYVGWGGWNWFVNRPFHPHDGVLTAEEPRQTAVQDGDKIRVGHWTLTVRAHYQITGRILGHERYHFDSLSDLIPEDLALGWGPMSDNRVLRTMDITQSNRFYYWRAPTNSLLPKDSIISHSANTHVIPHSARVSKQLSHLRPGQVVTLSGELVDGKRDDGRWINTSLVRNDTGAGACEVMLVNDVAVGE